MLGYRDSGMPGTPANERPATASPRPRWTRRWAGWWPSSVGSGRPGHRHLPRRADPVPAPRPPPGPRDQPGRLRRRRGPGPLPRGRAGLPAAQALLHGLDAGPAAGHARQVRRAGHRVAVRRQVAEAPGGPRRAGDHLDRHHRVRRRALPSPPGPCDPGRPDVEDLVRTAARGPASPSTPTTTTGWPSAGSARPTWSKTTCSPAPPSTPGPARSCRPERVGRPGRAAPTVAGQSPVSRRPGPAGGGARSRSA